MQDSDKLFIAALRVRRDAGDLPTGRYSHRRSEWWRQRFITTPHLSSAQKQLVEGIAQSVYAGSGSIVQMCCAERCEGCGFEAYCDPQYQGMLG